MFQSFNLTIDGGNDAMQTGDDVAAALRTIADKIAAGDWTGGVRDENGNTVGDWRFTS
jgi:hypothetical protein